MPRSQAPPPRDPELSEFASKLALPKTDPAFREALRTQLWELLCGLVQRLRGR